MPSFEENINTIGTAVYGKEMRPAIKEALLQSQESVSIMDQKIDALQKQIDAITGGGGGGGEEPDPPDTPDTPSSASGDIVGHVIGIFGGNYTNACYAGQADKI